MTQMMPHNWLITSCIINEFEKDYFKHVHVHLFAALTTYLAPLACNGGFKENKCSTESTRDAQNGCLPGP